MLTESCGPLSPRATLPHVCLLLSDTAWSQFRLCLCRRTGYGLEVDMWAAGVILYILLCGFPPFRSPERDQDELFNIIQLGRFEFLAPYWDNISDGEMSSPKQERRHVRGGRAG